jgi:hypothetical protein
MKRPTTHFEENGPWAHIRGWGADHSYASLLILNMIEYLGLCNSVMYSVGQNIVKLLE